MTKTDLEQVLQELTPVCVFLDPEAHQRHLWIDPPSRVELVAGDAVYLETSGRLAWDLIGIEVPFRLRKLRVRAAPTIEQLGDEQVLQLVLQVEHADFSSVPSFIEAQVISTVNAALTAHRTTLAWPFMRTLSFHFRMPAASEPRRSVHLRASEGRVEVRDDSLLVLVAFELDAQAPVIDVRSVDTPSPTDSPQRSGSGEVAKEQRA